MKFMEWLVTLVASVVIVVLPFLGEQQQAIRGSNYLVNNYPSAQGISFCTIGED